MGKMEMVPHLPALMQLESVKEVLKGFLWQGAAPGAHLRVACGRAVVVCLALRSSKIQAGTSLPLESVSGQGLSPACARWHLVLAPSSKELDLGMVCHLEAQAQAALLCASIPLGKVSW